MNIQTLRQFTRKKLKEIGEADEAIEKRLVYMEGQNSERYCLKELCIHANSVIKQRRVK